MAGQAIDITGQRFSHLVVLHRSGPMRCSRGAAWMCRCDCGTRRAVLGYHLRTGTTKSCGCLAKKEGRDGNGRYSTPQIS
jgi:hypothetical protein